MELVGKLLTPLLAQVGGQDHEQAALALGPLLREQECCFDRLAEADFVRQDRALAERVLEREERGFDLVRVEIDLCSASKAASLSTSSDAQRRVSSWAYSLAW